MEIGGVRGDGWQGLGLGVIRIYACSRFDIYSIKIGSFTLLLIVFHKTKQISAFHFMPTTTRLRPSRYT